MVTKFYDRICFECAESGGESSSPVRHGGDHPEGRPHPALPEAGTPPNIFAMFPSDHHKFPALFGAAPEDRPQGKNCALLWEFPGGKIEPVEQAQACVIRECREELDVTLRVIRRYGEVVCDYPDRTVDLQFFVCEIAQGEPRRKEHAALAWAHPQELAGYSFCPADAKMLREYGIVDALRT